MRRGKRGSGKRRLRELTRSAVETMEILEEVREVHSGVGGMSRALVQVVKLGLQTCLLEPEDRGGPNGGGSGGSSGKAAGGNGLPVAGIGGGGARRDSSSPTVSSAGCTAPPRSKCSTATSTGGVTTPSVGGGGGGGGGAIIVGKPRASSSSNSSVFLESGAGGGAGPGGEEALLPLGVASVLCELECCAAQALATLMSLNEGRPNHFGVFRAGVYVQEMRMLEAKILELVQQADNPREEKNAGLETTTVAAGIRNCVARLWWSRHAGENAETMTWEVFEEAFQSDFGAQLPKTLDVLRKHIAVQGDDYRAAPVPSTALPPPPPSLRNHRHTTTTTTSPRGRRAGESTPARSPQNGDLPATTDVTAAAAAAAAASGGLPGVALSAGESPTPASSRHHRSPSGRCARSSGSVTVGAAAAAADALQQSEASGGGGGGGSSGGGGGTSAFDLGTFAAAAAAIEAATAAAASATTDSAASTQGSSSSSNTSASGAAAAAATATEAAATAAGTPANGGGVGGGAQARSGERVVINVETGEEELQPQEEEEVDGTVTVARAGEWGALERGFSRLLSSVRREREGAGQRRGGADADGRRSGGSGGIGEEETSAAWRVTASLFEEVTWAHGGLYEAFQALADPRRVVFAMGVVDDGPHHEVGEGGEGWSDVSPVVVQGLLGLSVQQVCCGGQHAAVLTDCGEIFTWGRGGFGRLGHGNREGLESPRRIEALEGIPCVQVACGFAYTAAVTASGELYTWGAGENGRLGLGDVADRHTPSRVEGLHSKVKEVYAGSVHSCVLTREGTVYAFGKHEYTGHGDHEDVLDPRLIPTFSGGSGALVRQISVGPGGYHTMALTCQGQVYAWGHNRVAQLGIGNSFTVPRNLEGAYFLPSPQLVESLVGMNIVKVVAGWGHSAALTVDGQLYVCGRNYQGQLGLGSPQGFPQNERGHPFQADFCLIDRLQHLKIKQIACGGEHSVAVAENGEVWSFGAGQKGQLGHESTTREDFPRLVQALKRTRREIMHVACGNNCTLVLAGGVAFPTLFEMTAAAVRGNPRLWEDVESLGLLPPSVMDSLNRVVSD